MHEFDSVIDVRSPAEFALDHIPGAISAPVLSDDERARIGTLHKEASAFEAKRAGAALVAANIARHLDTQFQAKPKSWKPLIYCWRGGQRSGGMAEILSRIGWKCAQLDGGYRSYRRHVVQSLHELPPTLDLRIVCGVTGSGKSRLLRALAAVGAQVLDLEDLARHRGSVLGSLPGAAQPSQKMFESLVCSALAGYTPGRALFLEAESKKVGAVQVPDALMLRMRAAPCLRIEMGQTLRIALLKEEYAHYLADGAALATQLDCLVALHGHARIDEWKRLCTAGAWNQLVDRLLTEHYDPAYLRGMARNYAGYGEAETLVINAIDAPAMEHAARRALAMTES